MRALNFIGSVNEKTKKMILEEHVVYLPLLPSWKQTYYCRQMEKYHKKRNNKNMSLVYKHIREEIYRKQYYFSQGWTYKWRLWSRCYIVLEGNHRVEILHGVPEDDDYMCYVSLQETRDYVRYLL